MIKPHSQEGIKDETAPACIRYSKIIHRDVRIIHSRLPSKFKTVADIDDLYQESLIRVLMLERRDALEEGSLGRIVYCACVDYLRKNNILGRRDVELLKIIRSFYAENDRMPATEEFMQLTDVGRKSAEAVLVRLHPFIEGAVFMGGEALNFLESPGVVNMVTPEENVRAAEIARLVKSVLTDDELFVLEQSASGATLSEIGNGLRGVTQCRISQILDIARCKLIKCLEEAGIEAGKDFFPNDNKGKTAKIILEALAENAGEFVNVVPKARAGLIEAGCITDDTPIFKIKKLIRNSMFILRKLEYVIEMRRVSLKKSKEIRDSEFWMRLVQ